MICDMNTFQLFSLGMFLLFPQMALLKSMAKINYNY